MAHSVLFHQDFEREYLNFDPSLRKIMMAYLDLLRQFGATLNRPYVGTLKSKKYKNLKELRITTPAGEWRISFAFNPDRNAILLMGANKSGISQTLFYDKLIKVSEKRYQKHLEDLENAKKL